LQKDEGQEGFLALCETAGIPAIIANNVKKSRLRIMGEEVGGSKVEKCPYHPTPSDPRMTGLFLRIAGYSFLGLFVQYQPVKSQVADRPGEFFKQQGFDYITVGPQVKGMIDVRVLPG